MANDPLEPTSFDAIEVPLIWLPDGYDGPRPGHPWFETGRMTLGAEQLAAWPPADPALLSAHGYSAAAAGSVDGQLIGSVGHQYTQVQALGDAPKEIAMASWPGDTDGWATTASEPRRARHSHPLTGTTLEAWNALPGPRAILAALEAVSAPNSTVRALARDWPTTITW